jgi:DNA-binding CsgD family transcriptional regulator
MANWGPISMNIEAVAKRIPSLPPPYMDILACVAEGMSIDQIASKLGYKNKDSVSSSILEIYTRIGLVDVSSRTEKRQLAVEAFRISKFSKITVSLDDDEIDDILNCSRRLADRVVSVLIA